MGHVIGEIADVIFEDDATAGAFDFHVDAHGSYVRRRFTPSVETQRAHGLLNSAFWPVVLPVANPRHRSSILSAVYLALSIEPLGRMLVAEAIRQRHVSDRPRHLTQHVGNVLLGLPSATAFAVDYFYTRFISKRKVPGFFVRNRANRYGLSYHGEHLPNRDSRVWLTDETDRLGLPRLKIDLRFAPEDARSLVRTHDLLGKWLVARKFGRIEYRGALENREADILAQARHGTHQIGIARMGSNRRAAVADANAASFDVPNLYLAGCAILPTSGQANPTLTAIALALRLADYLGGSLASITP